MKTKVAAAVIVPALAVSSIASAHAGDTLGKIAENQDIIQNLALMVLTLISAFKKKKE